MQIHIGSKHLVADVAVALDVSGREYLVVVAKATWSIPEPGQRPRPLKPEPLVMADQFYGEPGESALRYGSDFARFKPQCDVIFDACAHAPGGKPVKQMEVSVQVGSMKKTVRVHGPRKWQRMLGVTRMGETEPFTRMPLHYGYAFGGTRWYDKGEQTLAEACLHNSSGIGYAGSKTASQMHGAPAPSLEDPKKAVSKPDGSYTPCALSPLARHWSPRRELGGTYNETWREEVFPLLPADFDEAYHQVAPVDQRIAYPSGGEEIMLKGVMSAFNVISFRLPQFPLHLHALRKDESSISALMYVDTLFFEPDAGRFTAVWRASVPIQKRLQEFQSVVVTALDREKWLSREASAACFGCGPVAFAQSQDLR